MIKILITGANGCIGSELVKCLMEAGYKINALAYDSSDENNIRGLENIEIAYGDICDSKKIDELLSLKQFDVIIHLAAIVHEREAGESDYERVNYRATVELFELAKKHHVQQFVFVSTVAVYGEETPRAFDEEAPCSPQTPYALSKWKAEEYIKNNCRQDINYTIIRSTTVYGKHDKGNIARLFRIARRGIVPVIGDGNNLKSLVFAENLASGITSALLNPSAYNQTFILSDDKSYSVNEIIKEIGNVIGRKIIVVHLPLKIIMAFLKIINFFFMALFKKQMLNPSSVRGLFTMNTFDISKAKSILNYLPQYSLGVGLKKTYPQA